MILPGYDAKTGTTVLARLYPFFIYPERYCPFCEHPLVTVNAVHWDLDPQIFKCIMICDNKDCEAFDEEARQAYCKVYYSSDEAVSRFETTLLKFIVEVKE